ncbi:peptidoglycan DD-metalloendopeptidase family protein [Microbacterium sp. SS28]|uniref:peptidoglycan DD-metalloendopeptidase family protein n=1 Tax=Microbacterium sp. SS28 TaxID=2919948 RepID=UPI001FA9701F|nr:peptidoglycan DD-metalloendopeptidase family protein [Microbacterium sp. SS28]
MLPPARARRAAAVLCAVLVLVPASAVSASESSSAPASAAIDEEWDWPVAGFRIVAHYAQPPHRYGAGHRGIDLEPRESDAVRAPAAGVVAFAGAVAGRPIVTIEHAGGFVTTLEPVAALVATGTVVARGDVVGTLAVGGHAMPGALHFGVRHDREYINPLLLIGGIPRAVLLPCCD